MRSLAVIPLLDKSDDPEFSPARPRVSVARSPTGMARFLGVTSQKATGKPRWSERRSGFRRDRFWTEAIACSIKRPLRVTCT